MLGLVATCLATAELFLATFLRLLALPILLVRALLFCCELAVPLPVPVLLPSVFILGLALVAALLQICGVDLAEPSQASRSNCLEFALRLTRVERLLHGLLASLLLAVLLVS